MATDIIDEQYLGQPFVETENSVKNRKAVSDNILALHMRTSDRFWQIATVTGILFAIGIVGYFYRIFTFENPGSAGYYVALFSFMMTTSAGAPMVAIAPRIANAHWRRPISRIAEIWTLIGCINLILFIPLLWVLPNLDNGRRSLWFYWEKQDNLWIPEVVKYSPHIWSTMAVLGLIVLGIALLWISCLPDFAVIRDQGPDGWRKKWASKLSLGWRGTTSQWNWQHHRMGALGALYFMMLVLVHFFISVEYLMVHVPGWIDSLYPITHAHNALHGGVATVMLTMFIVNRFGPFKGYITLDQFHGLGKLLLALSLLWFWFWFSSFMVFWYGKKPSEQALVELLVKGPYLYMFLVEFLLVFIIPWWTMIWNPFRRSIWGPSIIAISVLVGTFLDRIRLNVASWDVAGITARKFNENNGEFTSDFPREMMLNMRLPENPTVIKEFVGLDIPINAVGPGAIDVLVILGFISGAIFLYMMATRLIPLVNIWEQKELLLYNAEIKFHLTKVRVMGKPR
jgi:Ni/Fe-hydrogenase subunit HybB-like protein